MVGNCVLNSFSDSIHTKIRMDMFGGCTTQFQEGCNQHIKHVLQSYQSSAMNSLSGPKDMFWSHFPNKNNQGIYSSKNESRFIAFKNGKRVWKRKSGVLYEMDDDGGMKQDFQRKTTKLSTESLSVPILSAPDDSWHDLSETLLERELISCFSIGGERRLCLPQVLNSVLRGISITEIHSACDELHIFCSTCTEQQLALLKKCRILPPTASQCGLITKTDAERLCNELLVVDSIPSNYKQEIAPKFTLEVQHKCFGKNYGTLNTKLYLSPMSSCITCHQCQELFSPKRFVAHSHGNRETRVVHWGFDSSNWRKYLHVDPNQQDVDKKEKFLDEFINKFDMLSDTMLSCGAVEKPVRVQGSAPSTVGAAGRPQLPRVSPVSGDDGTAASRPLSVSSPESPVRQSPPSVLLSPPSQPQSTRRPHRRPVRTPSTSSVDGSPAGCSSVSAATQTDRPDQSRLPCDSVTVECAADVESVVLRVSEAVQPLCHHSQQLVLDTVRSLSLQLLKLRCSDPVTLPPPVHLISNDRTDACSVKVEVHSDAQEY